MGEVYNVKCFKEEDGGTTVMVTICGEKKYRYKYNRVPTQKDIKKNVVASLNKYVLSGPKGEPKADKKKEVKTNA